MKQPRRRGGAWPLGSAWGADSGGAERIWAQTQSGFSGGIDPEARLNAEAGEGKTESSLLLRGSRTW